MTDCPKCAELQHKIGELTQRNAIYRAALETIGFEAREALHIVDIKTNSIEVMELSVRTENLLRAANIQTIGELIALRETDLRKLHGLGRKNLTEIKELLAQYRLGLQP